jgi:hypothetical protein
MPDLQLANMDTNQLQTALAASIAAEDYQAAGRIRDTLKSSGKAEGGLLDWRAVGVPEWLADRAERLGYTFPTGEGGSACWPQKCDAPPVLCQCSEGVIRRGIAIFLGMCT